MNPDEEVFVRELTRELDEQINSVRRELDNLKRLGLLKSKQKNRKKYFSVNKQFVLYKDLRNIILKAEYSSENLVKHLIKMGKLDFLLVSGVFLDKDSPVDLLIVGDMDRSVLERFLDSLPARNSIKFSLLSSDDFVYRLKMRDQFILDLVQDPENAIPINKFDNYL